MNSKIGTRLLIGSALINLLLIGFFIGSWSNKDQKFQAPNGGVAWMRFLPPEQQNRFRSGLKERKIEERSVWREMEKHQLKVTQALTERGFEAKRVRALLEEQRKKLAQIQASGDEKLVQFFSNLSYEERQHYARIRRGPGPPRIRGGPLKRPSEANDRPH